MIHILRRGHFIQLEWDLLLDHSYSIIREYLTIDLIQAVQSVLFVRYKSTYTHNVYKDPFIYIFKGMWESIQTNHIKQIIILGNIKISLLYINNLHLMQESLFPRSSDEDKDIIHRMVSLVFLSRSGILHKLSQFFQSFWPNPCKKQIEEPVSNTRILFQFPLILMHLLLCIHIRMSHFSDVLLGPSWFVFMTLSILE